MRPLKYIAIAFVAMAGAIAWILYPPPSGPIEFPGGKRFALTIIDDTDQATLARIQPIYDLLHKSGIRTTKTVWVYERTDDWNLTNRGDSLTNPQYRQFVIDLQSKGFEIALHGVRGGTSHRQDTLAGLEEFKRILGRYPKMHINHSLNSENLYWGPHRWTLPPLKWGFARLRPFEFSGHDPASPYFWGDAARQHIQFVRRFTYPEINLLRVNPSLPYQLAETPFVNYWFDASDGGSIDAFDRLLSPRNLDRLEREGGVSFVYAHLGAGSFNKVGSLDPRFISRIEDLASRNGWYAPASEILEHLAQQPGWRRNLSFRERVRIELFAAGALLLRLSEG